MTIKTNIFNMIKLVRNSKTIKKLKANNYELILNAKLFISVGQFSPVDIINKQLIAVKKSTKFA